MDYFNNLSVLQSVIFQHIMADILVGSVCGIILAFAIVVMRRN